MDAQEKKEPSGEHVVKHDHCAECQKRVCLDFDCNCSEPGAAFDGKVFCPACITNVLP